MSAQRPLLQHGSFSRFVLYGVLLLTLASSTSCAFIKTVDLVSAVVGVAAEELMLKVINSKIVGKVAGTTAQEATKYLIENIQARDAAGNTYTLIGQAEVIEGQPVPVTVNVDGANLPAYLIFLPTDKEYLLAGLRQNTPPTCLLSRKGDVTDNQVSLSWRTHNATSAAINGINVSLQGERWFPITPTGGMVTFTIEVIGELGKDSHTISVQTPAPVPVPMPAEESEPAPTPSYSPSETPSPYRTPSAPIYVTPAPTPMAVTSYQVSLIPRLNTVYEDGSMGATDWSFVFRGEQTVLIQLPCTSYKDGNGGVDYGIQTIKSSFASSTPRLTLQIEGLKDCSQFVSSGTLELDLETLSQNSFQTYTAEVVAIGDPKKGHFRLTLDVLVQKRLVYR